MSHAPSSATGRYNIIWVFGDQHRGQAVGYMGDPNVHTPNLDRMAEEGPFSTSAVAGCPLCAPFRGSLLTGRYPHEAVPGHGMSMPDGMPTVAQPFNEAGYDTAWFGKWHVDGQRSAARPDRHLVPRERRGGFGTWVGYENGKPMWGGQLHGHNAAGEELEPYTAPGYETDDLTDLLIDYVRAHGRGAKQGGAGRPFFAALSPLPPHNPYVAPEQWRQRHTMGALQLRPNVPSVPRIEQVARRELAGYYAMIENLDWNLGRLRSAIEAAGLAHNTRIMFFSDHGDMHGSHGQFRKTAPWEEAIRIPFVVGGAIKNETREGLNLLVNHVDFGPTSLGLCGIRPPSWMVGYDYSPHLLDEKNDTGVPDSAYLQVVAPTGHDESVDRPWRGIVTRDGWKYVCLEGQPWLMFNLNEDPYEFANMAHNTLYAAERKRLHDRLAAWVADTGDTFALPEI